MKENWKLQTLDSLEKDIWNAPKNNHESYLMSTCYSLRKKPLIDFSVEDLRILIGQNIGLKYLIPIALEKLTDNILAEGDFYSGDLLTSVLTSNPDFWRVSKDNYKSVLEIFHRNEALLKDDDSAWEIKKKWFDSFKDFKLIQNLS